MRRWLAPMLLLALAGWEPFRSANPDVEAGNKAFAAGDIAKALEAYDRAAHDGTVDPAGLAYDRGTAELKQAEGIKDQKQHDAMVERGLESLKAAATSRDPRIRGQANYNRGNTLLGQDKLDDAIESYKQALKDQPQLDDARMNLELALKRREKKEQQQQQQGQGQGQNQQGQGQNQQGQGQQGQNQQGQQGQQGQNQQGQQGQQGQNQQGQGQQQQGQGSGQQQQQQGQGQGQQQKQNGQGQGSNDPQQGSGQGSNDQQNQNQQNSQRQHAGRTQPQGPKTPTDGKLDDLEDYSRQLQKDGARRRASGRAKDPDQDW